MEKKLTKKNLLIALAVFAAVSALAFWLRLGMTTETEETKRMFACLSDAFFISGVLFVGAGLLVWASNEGTFWGLGFAGSSALKMIIPPFLLGERQKNAYYSKNGRLESYGEYRERKKAEPKTRFWHLIVCGLLGLVLGAVFLALYSF